MTAVFALVGIAVWFVALYAAFSRGQITLLAPVAVVLVTRGGEESDEGPAATPPLAFALVLLAGVGFSIFFLALAETHQDAGFWPLVVARMVSVPVVLGLALTTSGGIGTPSRPPSEPSIW